MTKSKKNTFIRNIFLFLVTCGVLAALAFYFFFYA